MCGHWGHKTLGRGASWHVSAVAPITIAEIVQLDELTLKKLLETGEVTLERWK